MKNVDNMTLEELEREESELTSQLGLDREPTPAIAAAPVARESAPLSPDQLATFAGYSGDDLEVLASQGRPSAPPPFDLERIGRTLEAPVPGREVSALAGAPERFHRPGIDERLSEGRELLREPILAGGVETFPQAFGRGMLNAGRSAVDFGLGAIEFPLHAIQGIGEYATGGPSQPGRPIGAQMIDKITGAPRALANTIIDPAADAGADLGVQGAEAILQDPLAVPKSLVPGFILRGIMRGRARAGAERANAAAGAIPPELAAAAEAAGPAMSELEAAGSPEQMGREVAAIRMGQIPEVAARPPDVPLLPPGAGIIEVPPRGFQDAQTPKLLRNLAKYQKRQEGITTERAASERAAARARDFRRTEAPARAGEPEPARAPERAAESPRAEAPAPEPTRSEVPDWLRSETDRMSGNAERGGFADRIEELAAQRKTAKEIAKELGVDTETVYAVRGKRDIPSMDEGAEFDAWLKRRAAGPEVSGPPEAPPTPLPRAPAGSGQAKPGRQVAFENGWKAAEKFLEDPSADRGSWGQAFQDPSFEAGWLERLDRSSEKGELPAPEVKSAPPKDVPRSRPKRELQGSDHVIPFHLLKGRSQSPSPRRSNARRGSRKGRAAR